MWALSQLTLPAAYILAATGVCAAPPPPLVEMEFINTPPIERHDLSSRELGAIQGTTTFSHGPKEVFITEGRMISEFAPEYFVSFAAPVDPATGWYCLSVQEIKIKVNYTPTIYLASELQEGTCRYEVTLQHEARHVNIDIITYNEFLPVLRQVVQDTANGIGVIGPLKPENLIRERDRIVDKLRPPLEAKVMEIGKIFNNRQQTIDTRQAYLREGALCPNESVSAP
ncbi:MAG: hypothetical protein ACAH83_11480 [Alphaproteobacteria bacterium]